MNILKAAAQAAADVGTLYATAAIDDRIQQKREARLAARDERKFGYDKEIANMTHKRALERMGKENELEMERWKTQRAATAGEIKGTLDLGAEGKAFYDRQGNLTPIAGSKEAYKAGASAEAKTKELDQIYKLELELTEALNDQDIDQATYEAERRRLETRKRLLAADTPEERESILEQAREARDQARASAFIPGLYQKFGGSLDRAVEDAKRNGMSESDIDLLKRNWPDADNQQGGSADADLSVAERWKRRRDEKLRSDAAAAEDEHAVNQVVAEMKDQAKKMKSSIRPSQQEAVLNNYEFIRNHLSLFTPKEIRRFNAAINILNKKSGGGLAEFPEHKAKGAIGPAS